MKKLAAILALVCALAAPASAQQRHRFPQPATSSGPAGYALEFPAGKQTNVVHGQFWTAGAALTGPFFWEAWAMINATSNGYIISDGYGGDHAVLMGYNGSGQPSGNVWNGTAYTTIGCDDAPAVGEWHHLAMAWDGSATLYMFFDGITCGSAAFAGPRHAGAQGTLYVGGSDHSNFTGRLAAIRGFEGALPYDIASASFRPDRFFGTSVEGKDMLANLAFLADYTQPRAFIVDQGSYNGHSHPGRLANAAVIDKYHTATPYFTTPIPSWVADSHNPVNPFNPPAPSSWGGTVPTKASVPAGAIVFDSFSRADQTLAGSAAPTLGSTEGGSAGVETWQTNSIFGVLHGRAMITCNSSGCPNGNVAWVPTPSANMLVSVDHPNYSFNPSDDFYAFCRVTDGSNWYAARYLKSAGGVYLYKMVSGTLTNIGGPYAVSAFTTLGANCNGTTISVYTDGVLRGSVTDSSLTTGSNGGFGRYFQFTSQMESMERFDNFTIKAAL